MFNDSTRPTLKKVFVASVFGLCAFLVPNGVQSATTNSATIQWGANQESDLDGYLIYHGTAPGTYGISQNVGMTTTYQYTNLEPDTTHYFAVTAYDTLGNESPPSLEVFKTILSTPQPVADPSPTPDPAPSALAKAEKIRQYVLAKEEKIRQYALAKQKYALAKEERIRQYALAKQKYALAKEERIRQYVLAKEEKIRRYVLAKEERIRQYVLAKIQSKIAKIDQALVNSADNPTKVAGLNRQKESLLAQRNEMQPQ